eukprot:scaffold149460_cov69-Cyclotella_meneghiniana.AAC.4
MSGGEFDVEVPPPEGEAGDVGAMGRRTDCTKVKGDAKPGVFRTPWSSSPQRMRQGKREVSASDN